MLIEAVGVENPMLVLILGCIGLTLNIISAVFLHEHDHGPASIPTAETDSASMELIDVCSTLSSDVPAYPTNSNSQNIRTTATKSTIPKQDMVMILE